MPIFDQYLIDRNGDGFIDDATARIFVEPQPDIEPELFWSELIDIAARIGLGAQALPLPLFVADPPSNDIDVAPVRSLDDARNLIGDETSEATSGSHAAAPAAGSRDLLNLFTIEGLLDDRDGDLMPDATSFGIRLPDDIPSKLGVALCNLAVRIGLESGGITLPLVSHRDPALLISTAGERPRLTSSANGWSFEGPADELAQLVESVARDWPYFGYPETGGARSGVEWLKAAGASSESAAESASPVLWELQWSARSEAARLIDTIERGIMSSLSSESDLDLNAFACEPLPVRRRLEQTLRARAEARGVASPRVRVLSAFKVGLSWLVEVVLPELEDQNVDRLEVSYRRFEGAQGWEHLDMPIRWMQELFPGDEIAAARLGLPLENVVIVEDESPDAPIYHAVATAQTGERIGSWSLDLLSYAMPFLPNVDDSELVEVTTGGYIARIDGALIEERVDTDLDRFWQFWQREALPRVLREIERNGGFKSDRQPLFGALEVEVWLSSPNSRLRVREENDSAAEALHEDIYFNTLDTIEVLGQKTTGDRTSAPGAVIPIVHVQEGVTPHAIVRLRAAPPAPPAMPEIHVGGLSLVGDELVAHLEANDLSDDHWTAELSRLAQPPGRSYAVTLELDGTSLSLRLPLPEVLESDGIASEPPMDRNIHGPAVEIWAVRVARTDNVSAWIEGQSYQGRPISAVAVRAAAPGRVWSPAKLTALKPTVLIVARHHANEISSTNAALRLAHLCGTDDEWAELARRLNIVIIPYENADGAALHARLAAPEDAATWKHHPARYNALGHEFGEDFFKAGTPYGEARVRPALWRRWLPDAIVDNHGVPSHEWVQPFAGFGSPPRFRVSYWIPQALIYGIVRYIDDPEYPEHSASAIALREAVSAAFVDSEIGDLNREIGASYRRWGQNRVPDRFPGEFHNDMLWHFAGAAVDPEGRGFNVRYPRTTALSWVTEVNDETATGKHLATVATAHLEANRAMLRVVDGMNSGPSQSSEELPDGRKVSRFMRKRPLGSG